MGIEDCGAKFGQPLGDGRGFAVGAGDGITESQKHFGDAAHADAADAYQVNALEISEADHHGATFSRSGVETALVETVELPAAARTFPGEGAMPAACSIRLTMSRVAFGHERLRAAIDIRSICSGLSSSAKISLVRRSPVSSASVMTRPACCLAISWALRNWWLSVARPNGMKMAARPAAATSAAAMAPARHTKFSTHA